MQRRPLRLAVLDDNLFVRTRAGQIRPVAATFHSFVEAVARCGQFERVRYLAPVRRLGAAESEPPLGPVDESIIEVVPTASFGGIADYLIRWPYLAARNWGPMDRVIADSDLLWLRLPASNALLALCAARRHQVAHFGWLAGSASEVASAQRRPLPLRWAAQAVGAVYDGVSQLAGRDGPLVRLGADMFASIVTDAEVEQTCNSTQHVRASGPWRIVWAGRMASEKGLPEIIEAVRLLLERDRDVTLVLVGDGPARAQLESAAACLPPERVEWLGYVGERATYLGLLRRADLFIYPSRADAVPKVLIEALAAGVPVVAADVGAVAEVLGHGDRGRLVPAADAAAMADAADQLLSDPHARQALRDRGLAWAAEHTAEAQAQRLVGWLQRELPQLPWQ